MLASKNGYADVVAELIKNGASVATVNTHGDNALMFAATAGVFGNDVAKMLITAGAEPLQANKDGMIAIHFAKDAQIMKTLVETVTEKFGRDTALRMISYQDKVGRTPLHQAAERGIDACATLLIEAGADIQLKDKAGRRALDIAKKGSNNVYSIIFAKWEYLEQEAQKKANALLESIASESTAPKPQPRPQQAPKKKQQKSDNTKRLTAVNSSQAAVTNPNADSPAAPKQHPTPATPTANPTQSKVPSAATPTIAQPVAKNSWAAVAKTTVNAANIEQTQRPATPPVQPEASFSLEAMEQELRSACLQADDLDLKLHHLVGLGASELSMAQLTALEDFHHKMLRHLVDLKIGFARRQERNKIEEQRKLDAELSKLSV
jgi:hypothetical protein